MASAAAFYQHHHHLLWYTADRAAPEQLFTNTSTFHPSSPVLDPPFIHVTSNEEVTDQSIDERVIFVSMDFQENLFDAVVNGDEEAVLAMLRQGAQINNGDADGLTALHWASGNFKKM